MRLLLLLALFLCASAVQINASTISPLNHGGASDAVVVEDAGINTGSKILTSATAEWSLASIGKKTCLGAGAGGATLCSTITVYTSPTQVELFDAAALTVSNARMTWGTDNAKPFQDALDTAALGSIRTVSVPAGPGYLFTSGSLIVPPGVTLQGSWAFAPGHLGYRYSNEAKATTGDGSTLIVYANEGTATGQFILANSNSAVRGLEFFYPAQLEILTTPKVYPWTIQMTGMDTVVENIQFGNAYQAIYSHIGQRHLVRDIKGQPLLKGLYISQILDSSNYENIHWFPFYTWTTTSTGTTLTNLQKWVARNAVGFQLGKVDDARLKNCFAFGYFKWMKLSVDAPETTTFAAGTGAPGGGAWATVFAGGCDTCSYPLDVDDTGLGPSGVSFIGVLFDATQYQYDTFSGPELYAVFIRSSFTGRLSFTECRFTHGTVSIFSAAPTGRVSVNGNYFMQWSTHAIKITSGGVWVVSGNDFHNLSGWPVINIPGGPWIAVSSNTFEYGKALVFSVSPSAMFSKAGNAYADGPD